MLSHPDIAAIAAKYGKSTANVVLRWHLQMEGTMVCKVGPDVEMWRNNKVLPRLRTKNNRSMWVNNVPK